MAFETLSQTALIIVPGASVGCGQAHLSAPSISLHLPLCPGSYFLSARLGSRSRSWASSPLCTLCSRFRALSPFCPPLLQVQVPGLVLSFASAAPGPGSRPLSAPLCSRSWASYPLLQTLHWSHASTEPCVSDSGRSLLCASVHSTNKPKPLLTIDTFKQLRLKP